MNCEESDAATLELSADVLVLSKVGVAVLGAVKVWLAMSVPVKKAVSDGLAEGQGLADFVGGGDLVALATAVGVLEFVTEALGDFEIGGVLVSEAEGVGVLESCVDREKDGWGLGERETAAECVGV